MLKAIDTKDCGNALLRTLQPADAARLVPELTRLDFELGASVFDAGAPLTKIYFPERAIVSVTQRLADGETIEIAVVGSEGLVGWPLLLGCASSAHGATVHTRGGTILAAEAEVVLELCRASSSLWATMLRFVHILTVQMSGAMASHARDQTDCRVARWLLMRHDRLIGDEIRVLHDDIAADIGVRRASVTDSLHVLEGKGALRSRRGRVVVRNRGSLEHAAGEAYGTAEAEHRAVIGAFGKAASDGIAREWSARA